MNSIILNDTRYMCQTEGFNGTKDFIINFSFVETYNSGPRIMDTFDMRPYCLCDCYPLTQRESDSSQRPELRKRALQSLLLQWQPEMI